MSNCAEVIRSLREGQHDAVLYRLYALDGKENGVELARARAIRVIEKFAERFAPDVRAEIALFSSPGRTEIGGNHTDHQHGRVLCGSVDLDMLACAAPNGLDTIRICSEGYAPIEVPFGDLFPRAEERNTSAALVRGVAAKMMELGYKLCGFDAYVTSDIFSGSGLSSSAAYEVLIGKILNHYCGGDLDAIRIAKIGQYAENNYFGKPCGLMDQMSVSVGGAVMIDFDDPSEPAVKKVEYDFSECGHALCILETGSCHTDLTDDYAEITREMGAVAVYFGKRFLRDVAEEDFFAAISSLRACCGDRAVLRAIHYFEEDRRAAAEADALAGGDFGRFLTLVNESGASSVANLQNIWSLSDAKHQSVSLALALGKKLLDGTGAIRVHGGGFAGTVQAFVPNEKLPSFKSGMEQVFGPGKCLVLHIRPQGGCLVIS